MVGDLVGVRSFDSVQLGPRMNKWVSWAVAVFLITVSSCAYAQATGAHGASGSVEGHVVCDDGGSPTRLATVRLVPLAKL